MTAGDIVTAALREIRVLNAVDPATGEEMTLGLEKLNALLDEWNADRQAVYANVIAAYTLTPATNPHTIGPSGTWVTTQRPQSIEAANVISGTGTRSTVTIRDAAWWMSRGDRTFSADLPADLYYEPAWPDGKVWLLGVPSAANELELLTRVVLAQLAQATTFTLPPGYQQAITLTLAEALTVTFNVQLSPTLSMIAGRARRRVFAANAEVPRMVTQDSGMSGGACRGGFHYRTGRIG